jgi:hypothetical protein
MKDFSNYKKHIEVDMKEYSGKFHFNEQLKQEGTNVKINENSSQTIDNIDTVIRAIVRNHGNEYNESKEERSVIIDKKYDYKTGDYVDYLGDIYLTNTFIDKDNPFFNTAKMTRCNYILKWMDNGILNEQPCIITNNTKYTGGTKTLASGLTEVDAMVNITIQANNNTNKISYGKRLFTMKNAWRVTLIDDVTTENVLLWTLGKDSINYEIDDVDNRICGAYANKHTYIYNIPTSFEVANGSEYIINYSIKDETGKDFDYSLINVTTNNNTLVQVTNTKGVISIKGLSVGVGSIKLSIPIGSNSKDFDIAFEVKNVVVDKVEYKYDFKLGTTIKQYVTDLVIISKLINGIQDNSLKINYSFDANTQALINSKKIIVTKVSDLSFEIKNALVNVKTIIYLTVNDVDTGTKILDNFPLTLINGI